jgi:hypothetical protein
MVKRILLLTVVLLWVLSTNALQHGNWPTPPPAMDTSNPNPPSGQATLRQHIDLAQLQKEADDLARTAESIPADVASVRKGVLPKDTMEKLKQIEKLSKRLRSQLNP